jgi:DNA-directed RNA polymerase subunit M/transcription elongation factor TFIIS
MIDDGCPTCGSKKHAISKLESNRDSTIQFLKCQNCKKIWTP